jgi:peptide-methionine (R)-S-oxide reductase
MALGLTALAAPGPVASAMIGRHGWRDGVKLFARMLGGRDLALGLGVVIALDRGAPVRGWLEASAMADGVDTVACLLARRALSPAVFWGTTAAAGAAAAAGVALSRRLDPPPVADPGHPEAVATGHPAERVTADLAG